MKRPPIEVKAAYGLLSEPEELLSDHQDSEMRKMLKASAEENVFIFESERGQYSCSRA